MTQLPIDLDSILAHLVASLIALAGIAFLSPELNRLFGTLKAVHTGSTLIALMLGALVLGLVLSDIRTAVLDQTFRLNLSWIPSSTDQVSNPCLQNRMRLYMTS